MATKHTETGIEELRRAARIANITAESAFNGFTAEECLNLIRACWASGWDIFPDYLTQDEREHAAAHGKLSDECLARITRNLG